MHTNLRRGLLGTLFAGGLLALGCTAANAADGITTGDINVPVNVADGRAAVLQTGTVTGAGTGALTGTDGLVTGVLGNETTAADVSLGSVDTGAFVDGIALGDNTGTGAIAVPVNVTDANATILESGTAAGAGTGVLTGTDGLVTGVLGNDTTVADVSLGSVDTGAFVDGIALGENTGTGAIAAPVNVTDANATILETGTAAGAGTGALTGTDGLVTGVLGNETTAADVSLGSVDTGAFVDGIALGE